MRNEGDDRVGRGEKEEWKGTREEGGGRNECRTQEGRKEGE
jgi:hypothetical protein